MNLEDQFNKIKAQYEAEKERLHQEKIAEEQRKANEENAKKQEEEQRFTDGIIWQQVKEVEKNIQDILGSESETVVTATLAYMLRDNLNLGSFYDTLRKVKRMNDRLNKKQK